MLGGVYLSDARAKLQQLLDGDMDPSEIAKDPTLASLAERIYGMDIKALLAEKGISVEGGEEVAPASPQSSGSDMMIEVVPEASAPLPTLPPPAAIPEQGQNNSRRPLIILLGLFVLILAIYNLVIGIGDLYNPCTTDWCTTNKKLIWLAPHQISNDAGWGATGTPGIPDYAMIGGAAILTLLGLRKKS